MFGEKCIFASVMENSRIDWVDAMRGFSMILVVMGHVMLFMGLGLGNSVLSSIILSFRMPLFFFVSGFFAYRSMEWWTWANIRCIMGRKFRAQVVGTCVFSFVCFLVLPCWTGDIFEVGFGGGYWFTVVLFQMYIVYLVVALGCGRFCRGATVPILVGLAVGSVVKGWLFGRFGWNVWNFLCWDKVLHYFQYFVVGVVCSRYREVFERALLSGRWMTVGIVVTAGCFLAVLCTGLGRRLPMVCDVLNDVVVRYSALFVVVAMFRGYAGALSGVSVWARWLRFVGRRTLDIYFIHYFFIPDLSCLYPYLCDGNKIALQVVVCGSVTVVVVGLSLGVSAVLRRSRFLAVWLFGARKIGC